MTKEKAKREIDSLDYYLQNHTDDYGEESHTAMMMAIKALDQDPCEDCISREAVNRILDEISGDFSKPREAVVYVDLIADSIADLPSVRPKEKVGHWKIKEGKEQGYDIAGVKTWYIQIVCQNCGFIKTAIEGHYLQYNYCPVCGARMKGDYDDKKTSH